MSKSTSSSMLISKSISLGESSSSSSIVPIYSNVSRKFSRSRRTLSLYLRCSSGNIQSQEPTSSSPMHPAIVRKPCHTAVSAPFPPCSPLHSEPPSQMLIHISIISQPRLSKPLFLFRDIVPSPFYPLDCPQPLSFNSQSMYCKPPACTW